MLLNKAGNLSIGDNKMKLKCTKCNFKFKGDYSRLEKACPYCSKQGYIEIEDTEEEITKDVNEMF